MKTVRLYNTLSRSLEDFTPHNPKTVTLYTCGPTVYNYYHIGNLRNAIFNDTLRRALAAGGYEVRHVMNITDVGHLVSDADEGEDKLETGAKREGKTVWEVAEHYTDAFKKDMAALNILPPSVDPQRSKNQQFHDAYARATDFIPEQIEMVKQLLDKGYAYQTEQAIYFEVSKLANYGELSGQTLAAKEVAVRSEVVTDPDKRSPHDFAVWFFAVGHFSGHSMQWDSPWGKGFPGWHLECSAIIHATLGDPIDIHTGGIDHIGTHHPNEMAQTEAAFDHPLANYWIHNEFILVDGVKMSKSKNNAYTLADLQAKGFHPLSYRLLCLQAHYRSELNFTWESLAAAQNRLLSLYAWADQIHQEDIGPLIEQDLSGIVENDLNTAMALAKIDIDAGIPTDTFLKQLDKLFGLSLAGRPNITSGQKQLIAGRETARAAKDWAKADQLRDELGAQNLEIDDTPSGPRWRRTTIL